MTSKLKPGDRVNCRITYRGEVVRRERGVVTQREGADGLVWVLIGASSELLKVSEVEREQEQQELQL